MAPAPPKRILFCNKDVRGTCPLWSLAARLSPYLPEWHCSTTNLQLKGFSCTSFSPLPHQDSEILSFCSCPLISLHHCSLWIILTSTTKQKQKYVYIHANTRWSKFIQDEVNSEDKLVKDLKIINMSTTFLQLVDLPLHIHDHLWWGKYWMLSNCWITEEN